MENIEYKYLITKRKTLNIEIYFLSILGVEKNSKLLKFNKNFTRNHSLSIEFPSDHQS